MKRILCFGFLLVPFWGVGQVVDTAMVLKEVDSLVATSTGLWRNGKFEEALTIAWQAAGISKEKFGENTLNYATTLHRLASIYTDIYQFDTAEVLFLKAIDLKAKFLGKDHLDYAKSLTSLAVLYDYYRADYIKAESLYLEVKEIKLKLLGNKHLDYAWSLNSLANIYSIKGNYSLSESYFLDALEIITNTLGKEHLDYAWTLNSLANLYLSKGEYIKAESMYFESIEIRKKQLGEESPLYAESINNLAILYDEKGEYSKAEQLYLKSKKIRETTSGKASQDYIASLNNLAVLYHATGDYSKAESTYLEAKEIWAKALGTQHPQYATILNNLANFYSDTGEYEKAEPLYLEANEIWGNTFGKEHSQYAYSINGLGMLYMHKGDFVKSETFFLEAVNIWKNNNKKHMYYAKTLGNLANLYYKKGDSKAEQMYLEVTEALSNILGNEHPDFAVSLINLASLYKKKGDFVKSESLGLKAKEIFSKSLGKKSSSYSMSLNNLAKLYQLCDRIPESVSHFIEAEEIDRYLIQKSIAYSSEIQMLAYMNTFKERIDYLQSFTHSYSDPSLRRAAFDNIICFNGLLLENTRSLTRSVTEADTFTRDIYNRWQGCQRRLAKEYSNPIAERKLVVELEIEAESYEKKLIRSLPLFASSRQLPQWQDVRNHLHQGEVGLEFIHYHYFSPEPTDSTIYAALLLLPNDTAPHFIPLCEERQLDALIFKPNGTRANYLQNLYSSPRADGLASLFQLIWAPIEKILKENGIKTVYYAPSGLLHRLNLSAIAPDKTGQTLADRYHLVPVASTRQLVTDHSTASAPTSAIIYGGVRYDMDSTAIARANKDLSTTAQDTTGGLFRYAARGGERADNWDTLPGTKREAKYLYELLSKRGINATLRLGYAATEESFKQIGQQGPSPSLLHIGTHGFFFPDPKDTTRRRTNFGDDAPVFKISEHPLIRSGLKLAGSKYAWENKHPMGGMEDGILTAYEVSQMNLSNTQLVVLSACETGLGDIKGNEGVYGLQRAFRIAGAKNVLMSLWKVPDEATEKLMTQFYKNWLEQKMPLRTAFETAQKWLRGQKGYENPYFWAGFVLIGEL